MFSVYRVFQNKSRGVLHPPNSEMEHGGIVLHPPNSEMEHGGIVLHPPNSEMEHGGIVLHPPSSEWNMRNRESTRDVESYRKVISLYPFRGYV